MHQSSIVPSITLAVLAACATTPEPFALEFVATQGEVEVGCDVAMTGLGDDGAFTAGLSDLRFYVSNLRFVDAAGEEVEHTIDHDEFHLHSGAGRVTLVDLASNTSGTCASTAIAYAEGTARTHPAITGTTVVGDVAGVRFDVGVPQALMQEVVANETIESAPSPLDEMYWSWASGYRHFVLNFAVTDDADGTGDGYVHIGSRDCSGDGELALESRDACGFLNTPAVAIDDLDLTGDRIAVDLGSLLDGVDFSSPVRDPDTLEVVGAGPGVECHSSPMQEDCAPLFGNLGLEPETGDATASGNLVFGILP